jgi:secreted trypsin-like serine protease
MLGHDNTRLVVQDTIDIMCCRAIAVLESLSNSFIYGGNKLNDSGIYWSLNSAIMELRDIQEVLNQDKKTMA